MPQGQLYFQAQIIKALCIMKALLHPRRPGAAPRPRLEEQVDFFSPSIICSCLGSYVEYSLTISRFNKTEFYDG